MYENENLGDYQSSGVVFTPQQSPQMPQDNKKEKKKPGFMKKAVAAGGLGLFFGMFAGLSFYGVFAATGFGNADTENKQAVAQVQTTENDMALAKNEDSDNTHTGVSANESNANVALQYNNAVYTGPEGMEIADVVKQVMPSMVSIVNKYTTVGSFWGQRYSEENEASGSGFVVADNDDELLIVTNYHVAAKADKLEITFIDDTVVEAKIKGVDSSMDLAVLAVNKNDLSLETLNSISIAKLGNSDALVLGEPVIAIGNALGYGQSVTNGIVSALNRNIDEEDRTFIQTNAAINPGNSGGALLNYKGEVVGINSNKIGGSAIEGMGYAIPISAAEPIISELMEHQTKGEAVAEEDIGYMGVSLQGISQDVSEAYGMPIGVYVYHVEAGSAAEKAGILKGDIIVKIEGEKIEEYADLQNLLKYYAAGETVNVTVMRPENGEYREHNISITLGRRNIDKQQ